MLKDPALHREAARAAKGRAGALRRRYGRMVEAADDHARISTMERGKPRAGACGEVGQMSTDTGFGLARYCHIRDLARARRVGEQLDHEGEATIVTGKGGRRIPREATCDHIAALTLCNEGTIRDWVRHAKFIASQGRNRDASGSIGPWPLPFGDPAQVDDIKLETRESGEVRQSDRTGRMHCDFRCIATYVSTFTTLVPGDVVEVDGEEIGILRNGIEDEAC